MNEVPLGCYNSVTGHIVLKFSSDTVCRDGLKNSNGQYHRVISEQSQKKFREINRAHLIEDLIKSLALIIAHRYL